jgi:hypothetical protein
MYSTFRGEQKRVKRDQLQRIRKPKYLGHIMCTHAFVRKLCDTSLFARHVLVKIKRIK